MAKIYAQSDAGFIGWVSIRDVNKAITASNNDQTLVAEAEPQEPFYVEVGLLGYGTHRFYMPDDGHDILIHFYGNAFDPHFEVKRR